ncbi:MAG: hypothetical protein IKR74_03710 [Bacilli bacterium]|nr:hypothetical protein [Bacilli bacterium]
MEVEHYGIDYKTIIGYTLSADNELTNVIGKEFLLFNKFQLWSWIS